MKSFALEADCKKVVLREYQSAIGALMYLAVTSRPDILHSVSKLAQRNCDPHEEHIHEEHIHADPLSPDIFVELCSSK